MVFRNNPRRTRRLKQNEKEDIKISYLFGLLFALSSKSAALREFWRIEIIRQPAFSWRRLYTHSRNRRRNFLLWWRLASEMYTRGNKAQRKAAKQINDRIKARFTTDIGLDARIGAGLHIPHHTGVVISDKARIGKNLVIRQNTTIGVVKSMTPEQLITLGDNVDIGANSCIIGAVTIGDNVTLGAMSFVNQDIPANSVFITRKTSQILLKPAE